jgi:hypothetical protein
LRRSRRLLHRSKIKRHGGMRHKAAAYAYCAGQGCCVLRCTDSWRQFEHDHLCHMSKICADAWKRDIGRAGLLLRARLEAVASLPQGPQAHLEYQGICRRSVPRPSEGPYTSRIPTRSTRSAKDIATGILLMLGVDLLDGMCLMHIPLAGIATTSTVQPKLSEQLTVHGA